MADAPSIEVQSVRVIKTDRYGCRDDLFTLVTDHKPDMGEQMRWSGVLYVVVAIVWEPEKNCIEVFVSVK